MKLIRQVISVRLDAATLEKLEKLQTYHQKFIDMTCKASNVESIPISKAKIIASLITERYDEMNKKGLL